MGKSIDERVVSMKFDNKQFQSGVSDSLNSINKLKSGLNFKDSTKSFDAITASASRVNFDGMTNGLETVKLKFSALQVVALAALANITNSALNAGKNIVSSLTIDPVMDGFREYETQMNAIQTILANTSTKGTSLEDVKKSLAELNTYSDKTIYNFTEMTKNIGTFTAAGVDLKTSTAAIKGIANLAAVSGSTSEQASTAMYQLSQALAAGKVSLMDWNSVVNAGMGGEVFQKSLMETARVHGVAIDAMVKSEGGFRNTLQKGWLTSSILTETLNKFTGDLNESQLKSMGYTDEQIAGIIKMGKTASDAATKVKTITQLFDTLKEAVGSGWAQTWQTVFGDFEEAKVLFTSVSDVLGGMIGATSDARNKMLTGWKDLGGRTALIDGIKNAFDGVMGVVKSIGGAFRDIFPATTSAQLFNFTNGFKNLTEYFKLSDSTLSNLKSTFKGVFAILDVGKTIFLAVANSIGIMLGGAGNLGATILSVTGAFGEWLAAIDKTIKQSDVFNKVLSTLAYGIKNGLSGIASVFDVILKGLGSIITAISTKLNFSGFELFQSFLGLIGKRMESIGTEANSMTTTVGGAFVAMGAAVANSKFGEILSSIYDTVKTIAGAIGTLINRMVDSISNSLKNADFSSVLDGLTAISIGGMLLAFKKFMKGLSETFEESTGFLGNIKGVLDDVRGSFEAYQQNLKAGVLIKIGTAIALLAGSIVAISLIDSGKLASSLAAIGTLFAQLLVAMKLYTMIGDFKSGVIKAGVVMLAMSTSILILSGAMKNISSLDWNGVAKGAVGIAALAGILVASAKVLSSGSKDMIKGSAGMVVFAAAIKILASACIELSTLNWEQMKIGLIGVGALMVEISLFMNNTKFSAKSISTAIGITILAGAIKILASACYDLGSMDWGNIVKGLKSIGILLTELLVFTNLTGNAKNVISTGIALVAIGGAMKILASAVNDFGDMDWGDISKGLKAMGIVLAEIAIAVNLMPKNLPVIATGLILVGAALKIIASSMMDMGSMPWESVKIGLIALGGSLGILAIALKAMTGTISGSAALLVAAGALAILAPTLVLLGTMTWESIIRGLVNLAATIAIFGLSAAVLTPLIPSMLGLAAAMTLFGISILGIGAGLALVGVGLAGMATGFAALAGVTAAGATAIVTSLGIIVTGVAALIPAIMGKIGEGILAFCKVITDGMPAIVNTVTVVLKAIIDCIVTNTPAIINGVMKILSDILDALIKWVPTIIKKVVDLMIAMLKVIADNVPRFMKSAVDVIVAFIKGITDNLSRIIDAAFKLIVSFINGLADAIRNNSGPIGDACLNLVMAIVDGIGSLSDKFIQAGAYAVEGFVKGLLSLPGKLWDAGASIGNSALKAAKDALGIHSPSRAFKSLGEFSVLGFVGGLGRFGSKVMDASASIGEGAVDSMSNSIKGISDIVSGNIDSQPVIRPVLDLTDIQNGANNLYSMFGEVDGYSINRSINTTNSIAKSIKGKPTFDIADTNSVVTKPIIPSTPRSPKQPVALQLMLQNGRAIAEYIIDDVDSLMGTKNKITGRMVGV